MLYWILNQCYIKQIVCQWEITLEVWNVSAIFKNQEGGGWQEETGANYTGVPTNLAIK